MSGGESSGGGGGPVADRGGRSGESSKKGSIIGIRGDSGCDVERDEDLDGDVILQRRQEGWAGRRGAKSSFFRTSDKLPRTPESRTILTEFSLKMDFVPKTTARTP